jgi:hypothetical protein
VSVAEDAWKRSLLCDVVLWWFTVVMMVVVHSGRTSY